ncbi:hypothetical protein [Wolbachia endosymbiont of Pentidionis agamae]|uniref:hypothetical protein n=1 Tax=Wolbachia endosymbiont of Pentidionis agamae TaxID=3110435 RepID=UPI002FD641C4
MAKGGKAKTASKNNPLQRNKGTTQKTYNGKNVVPVRLINRELNQNFMAAEDSNGNLIEDGRGNPIAWDAI